MCISIPCGYSSQTLTKIIAYIEISFYVFGIVSFALFGVVLESRADILNDIAKEDPAAHFEIDQLLKLEPPYRTCIVLWMIMNFIAGLVFNVILLQGAQERNLTKIKIWFAITILGYMIWTPLLLYWIYYSPDPVSPTFQCLMGYFFGGICLWVVHSFMQELKIESNYNGGGGNGRAFQTVAFSKI